MATTSKEGSRRVNYPILTQGGSDNKSQCGTMFCNWIENNVQTLSINNWRASLVPAAAVIPAPIAYINVVAVKKLVVEMWDEVYNEFLIQFYIDSPLQFIIMGINLFVIRIGHLL